MSSIKLDTLTEYKECAGKGCHNVGIHYLEIIFLNKSGWFCEQCGSDLIVSGLAKGLGLGSGENIWQK
jgi:hypothetical protein